MFKKKMKKKSYDKHHGFKRNVQFLSSGFFVLLLILILGISVGYSALNQNLTISGEAHFRIESDIRITNINLLNRTYNATTLYRPDFSRDTIITGINLPELNSTITFEVTVQNFVDIEKYLKNIVNINMNNPYITYTLSINIDDTVDGLEQKTFTITFHYRDDVLELPSNTQLESRIQFIFDISATSPCLEILFAGTVGPTGAPWELCDNGTLYVFEGTINWATDSSPWITHNNVVTNIVFTEPITAGPTFRGVFAGMTNLVTIDGLPYINTDNVTAQMYSLFRNTHNLRGVPGIETWNTSRVTNMGRMFQDARSITEVDLSSWDTSNVLRVQSMFQGAQSLTSVGNLSNWDMSNVDTMHSMFLGASSLVSLPGIEYWNTSNVGTMQNLFADASSLTHINVSNWDTSSNQSTYSMFRGTNIGTLDLSNWNMSNTLSIARMFNATSNLTSVGDLSGWDTSSVDDMRFVFQNATGLTSVNLVGWNTSNVTRMDSLFAGANQITSLDLSTWDTSNVVVMNNMFQNLASLRQLRLGNNFIITPGSTQSVVAVPNNTIYTGLWINESGTQTFTSNNLINNFRNNPNDEIWMWQIR